MGCRTTSLIAFLFFTVSCGEDPAPKETTPIQPLPAWVTAGEPAPYLVKIVGKEALAIVRNADRVETFRISSGGADEVTESVGGHAVIAKGPDLDAEQRAAAISMLTRIESYSPFTTKACAFTPGVALRFHRGNEQVTALICFSCADWAFQVGTSAGRGRPMPFDGAQVQVLKLTLVLFPDDPSIASVPAHTRYSIAYQVPTAIPSSYEDIRKEIRAEHESPTLLAKYLPQAVSNVKSWDFAGGLGDSVIPMDGLLFVYTTKENHDIISKLTGVRAVP